MEIQEHDQWICGCIDIDLTQEFKKNKFFPGQSPSKKFYNHAAIYNTRLPIWAEPLISNLSKTDRFTWSLQCLYPNTVIDVPEDYKTKKVTTLIFLEDWQPGNYFELDGHPFVGWKSGTFVAWATQLAKIDANLGRARRYNLELIAQL